MAPILTFVICFADSDGEAELDGTYDPESARLADESCQTTLSMPEMQVVSSLAQMVYCERRTTPIRGGASAESCASEMSGAPSVTWASEAPAATAKNQVYPHVARTATPRPGSQPSPPKGSVKAKWNSTVKCSWPPTSPLRFGGGGAPVQRRPASTPGEGRMKTVGVMTFPAINAAELIKKVEALEFELDFHVGNERQLLTVNEKLRKRSVIVVEHENAAFQ